MYMVSIIFKDAFALLLKCNFILQLYFYGNCVCLQVYVSLTMIMGY